MNLMGMTAVELGKAIKDGQVSVVEATQACLDSIEACEKDYNSFVTVDREGALAQAEEVQKKIDAGELNGPLAGVPIAIKDNMCQEGVQTSCSSKILSNFVPTYTAEAVVKLKEAGAVIVGHTNMDEFAMGSTTETSYFGETRNPWDTNRVPGGSSGGSAAAVGAMCPRFRYRWIHQTAGFILRCYRNQANLWKSVKIRTYSIRFIT